MAVNRERMARLCVWPLGLQAWTSGGQVHRPWGRSGPAPRDPGATAMAARTHFQLLQLLFRERCLPLH